VAADAIRVFGVGTNELITYPYWCLEKGYGRFAGERDRSPDWAERANGWIRVMRWDAGISMVIYTFATIAFYLLGAAVLHSQGLDPAGNEMIRVLGEMYVPVFGAWAKWLFLFGAFAVLYSTFFVANAGHTRVAADAIRVFGVGARTERARRGWVLAFCVAFPLFALFCYVFIRYPARLVLASGVMQAIMLPMLAAATLYYRYRRCDRRILPGRLWDLMLWLCALGMLIAGGWIAVTKLVQLVGSLVR
jgi:Mn2+/Fe2+ NRAMP family transporter